MGETHQGLEPRADLADAASWLALGGAALAGSMLMDRLEEQDVPSFAAPGLLPGLLALMLLALGSVLLVRSLRRPVVPGSSGHGLLGPAPGRALLVIGLCVLFGTVLVGHGLPFWLATALFVTAAILLLRIGPDGRRAALAPRPALAAALIGLAAGGAITGVFQMIFLVRLP